MENIDDLQLDTVAIAGARSHVLVLISRLEGLDPDLCEPLPSPGEPLFDPVLQDRVHTDRLFEFHQVLEIFKPQTSRLYGDFCLPVLVGDQLVARVDLKADRKLRQLAVLALHYESSAPAAETRKVVTVALSDYAAGLELSLARSHESC